MELNLVPFRMMSENPRSRWNVAQSEPGIVGRYYKATIADDQLILLWRVATAGTMNDRRNEETV